MKKCIAAGFKGEELYKINIFHMQLKSMRLTDTSTGDGLDISPSLWKQMPNLAKDQYLCQNQTKPHNQV